MKSFSIILVCILVFSAVIYIGDAESANGEPDEYPGPDGPDSGTAIGSDDDTRYSKRWWGDSWLKTGKTICGNDKLESAYQSVCNYRRDAEDAIGFLKHVKRYNFPSRLREECCNEGCVTEEIDESCN